MNYGPLQPIGTCLRCQRPVYPPNFVAYQAGPVHTECVQQQAVRAQNVSSTPAWAVPLAGTAVFGGVLLIFLSAAGNSAKPPPPKQQIQSETNALPTPRPVSTPKLLDRYPVATLLTDYKQNEVRADSKYKGTKIQVVGVVDDIKKDLMDEPYVTIGTGADFEIPQVQCMGGKKQEAAFAKLNKGQKVVVQGDVDGLMMNVLLSDCVIVP